MKIHLSFSTLKKPETYWKAFISDQRLDHTDRAPVGIRSSLVGILVSRLPSVSSDDTSNDVRESEVETPH